MSTELLLRRPEFVEFQLDFVIRSSGVSQPRPDRRLNGIENTIAALARSWRPFGPVAPVEELRMAPETLEQLRAWVEGAEASTGRTAARLAAYDEARDASVRAGWVRLELPAGRA